MAAGIVEGLVVAGLTIIALNAAEGPERVPTDRSIELALVVEATPAEVFEMWTDAAATEAFFSDHARIEPRQGGAYEIYFLPADHPEGDANSSRGARILAYEPGRLLSFEWTAPPFASELNTRPLPTWVEIRLAALPGHPDRTDLQLAHHGFGRGGAWDRTYEFFVRGWGAILHRLDRHLALRSGEE